MYGEQSARKVRYNIYWGILLLLRDRVYGMVRLRCDSWQNTLNQLRPTVTSQTRQKYI